MQGLLHPLILLLLLLLPATANADVLRYYIIATCSVNLNYTRGSAFQANLNASLSALPAAAAASSGFAENVTGGAAPDQVYGLAQCRGDLSAADCRSCLNDSAREMAGECPGQKRGMLIYEGCLLRYSNASFFGVPYVSDPIREVANPENVEQPEQFMPLLSALMGNLTRNAAHGSPRMFAAGAVQYTSFVTLYGLAQCTRDTSPDNCGLCLAILVDAIPKCCYGRKGGRVFSAICQLRFEIYPFYNAQGAQAAMAMSPTPAPGGVPVNGGSELSGPRNTATTDFAGSRSIVRTALIIVSILAAVSMLLLLIVASYVCKKSRKPHMHVQLASDGKFAETLLAYTRTLCCNLQT